LIVSCLKTPVMSEGHSATTYSAIRVKIIQAQRLWNINYARIKKGGWPILNNDPEFKRRVLCFAGSVLFHILVLLAIFISFQPIDIPLEERVTEVVITPQKDLLLPHLERLLSGRGVKTIPESRDDILPSTRTQGTEPSRPQRSQPQGQMGSIDRAPSPPPEITKGFKLTPTLEGSSGFSLNISPSKDLGPEPEDYLRKEELDLLLYLSSETSTQRPLGTSPSTETYGARISTPGKGAFDINQIDISPWARDVVEKIQKNWSIPESQEVGGKKSVEITVSIGKNGELLKLSIRNSSAHPTLDQAALNAVRMSAPFSGLPDDFPNDSVQAHFLFRYDD
jgi:TonB family protein